jgi:hypothetical protein
VEGHRDGPLAARGSWRCDPMALLVAGRAVCRFSCRTVGEHWQRGRSGTSGQPWMRTKAPSRDRRTGTRRADRRPAAGAGPRAGHRRPRARNHHAAIMAGTSGRCPGRRGSGQHPPLTGLWPGGTGSYLWGRDRDRTGRAEPARSRAGGRLSGWSVRQGGRGAPTNRSKLITTVAAALKSEHLVNAPGRGGVNDPRAFAPLTSTAPGPASLAPCGHTPRVAAPQQPGRIFLAGE